MPFSLIKMWLAKKKENMLLIWSFCVGKHSVAVKNFAPHIVCMDSSLGLQCMCASYQIVHNLVSGHYDCRVCLCLKCFVVWCVNLLNLVASNCRCSNPESCAVEIFVRTGGDARFQPLGPAFLHSPAATSFLDVQVMHQAVFWSAQSH
jgi:hypothetical protein